MKPQFPWGQPPKGVDVLWRCEAKRYSYIVDADRDEYGVTDPHLELAWFPIIKRTPKGAWIDKENFYLGSINELNTNQHSFVLLSSKKAFASLTIEAAIQNFADRRKRQIWILNKQLHRAKQELALTQSNLLELPS